MTAVDRIVEKFGGAKKMAAVTGFPRSTIQSWEDRGIIGAKRQRDILEKARELGIDLEPADFFDVPRLRKGKAA